MLTILVSVFMLDCQDLAPTVSFLPTDPLERQERQSSPPRRVGRYRGESGDNDEFLRMLGITSDEQPKPNQTEVSDSGK